MKIILFAVLYTTTTILIQKLFNYNSSIGIALIIFGIFGYIYTLFILLHKKIWRFFYFNVTVDFSKYCIGKARSINYGEIIYFPYIKYKYEYKSRIYKSSSLYWDFESSYETIWIQTKENDKKEIDVAVKKLEEIINEKKDVYILKVLPSVSYLDINLSKKRKIYFLFLNILALFISLIGIYLL
jgi:hypothetical protein